MKALKLRHLSILLVALLSGCGGSSSSSSSSASDRISYDGSTDPASLTATNSPIILGGAVQGGQTGTAFGSVAALTDSSDSPHTPRTLVLSQELSQIIREADLSHLSSTSAAVNNVSNQTAGNCGGQMSYSGTADDTSRQFYATFTFTDYCQDATTFSGTVTASGQTDAILGFENLSLSFDALTIASNGDSFTANGYEIITPATSSYNVKMNMLLQDSASKLVYKIDQLKFIVELNTGSINLGITSGRYYDPRYGYVDLSTPTYLTITNGDYWPSAGIIKATGGAGSQTATTGINTNAMFTALNNTTYQLDVDPDGSGGYSTTTGTWSSL